MSESLDPDSKVLFRVPYNDDTDDAEVETLWAWKRGDDLYELDNLPYFAYGVSCGDIVLAPYDEDEEFPTFVKVVTKSGNRTVRLIFDESELESKNVLDAIVGMGCDFEGANTKYVAVNVPSEIDFEQIIEFLIKKETQFEFADPTYEEYYGEDME